MWPLTKRPERLIKSFAIAFLIVSIGLGVVTVFWSLAALRAPLSDLPLLSFGVYLHALLFAGSVLMLAVPVLLLGRSPG